MGGEKERGKSAQIYGNGNENETNINTYLLLKIILNITNAKSRKKSYWPKKIVPFFNHAFFFFIARIPPAFYSFVFTTVDNKYRFLFLIK